MSKINTPEKRQECVDDWNRMVATVSEFSEKWDLPKADMVFHPKALALIRTVAQENIRSTLIHLGVRVRFGIFEQAEIIRPL